MKARLAYSTISQLSYIVLGGGARDSEWRRFSAAACTSPCTPSARSRSFSARARSMVCRAQDRDQRHARHRPPHAGGRRSPSCSARFRASSACRRWAARGASGSSPSACSTRGAPRRCSSRCYMISSLLNDRVPATHARCRARVLLGASETDDDHHREESEGSVERRRWFCVVPLCVMTAIGFDSCCSSSADCDLQPAGGPRLMNKNASVKKADRP